MQPNSVPFPYPSMQLNYCLVVGRRVEGGMEAFGGVRVGVRQMVIEAEGKGGCKGVGVVGGC